MILTYAIFVSFILFFISTKEAHAIIVIIPAILIPIVSIVVWIITAVTTPVLALSIIYFKIKKKSPFLGILFGVGLLLLLGAIITVILKLLNPERPIY
jgi:hypothetical protein